jgi:hypothetical protein
MTQYSVAGRKNKIIVQERINRCEKPVHCSSFLAAAKGALIKSIPLSEVKHSKRSLLNKKIKRFFFRQTTSACP